MRLFIVLVSLILAVPATADKLPLSTLSAYFDKMKTAQGSFRQINGDGSISTGTIQIKRPGRMLFEYAPPDRTVVLAANRAVYIVDKKSNGNPETYPLKRTPLWLILQRNVDLSNAKMVVGHDYDGSATIVTAQDPDEPQLGNIRLYFTGNPVALRQWVITDESGGRTTVVLNGLQTGGTIRNSTFDLDRYVKSSDR